MLTGFLRQKERTDRFHGTLVINHGRAELQLFLKTLARDANWEKILRDHEKLAYR